MLTALKQLRTEAAGDFVETPQLKFDQLSDYQFLNKHSVLPICKIKFKQTCANRAFKHEHAQLLNTSAADSEDVLMTSHTNPHCY